MLVNILIASFLTGLFELDETGAFQIMLSRSIVSGTVIGYILGLILGIPIIGLRFGFLLGLLFDLIWLFRLPIGASIPPDYQLASAVSIIGFLLGFARFNDSLAYPYLFFCVMFGFLSGYIGAWLDVLVRKFNISLFRLSRLYWSKGDFGKFKLMSLFGIINFFLKAFVVSVIMVSIIILLNPVLEMVFKLFPQFILTGFYLMIFFIPAIGFIVIINNILKESTWFILLLGIIAGIILFGFFREFYLFGFIGIVLICVVLTLQLIVREKKR